VTRGASGGAGPAPPPRDAGDEVAAIAREGEPDRYLAGLLAPETRRPALLALAALSAELARIPHRAVREPFMGEIRLQWWRTALGLAEEGSGGERNGSGGHAVAEAVRAATRVYNLPAALLGDMIEARALELQPAPFEDDAALQGFHDRTEGAQFALACRVVGLGGGSEVEAACRSAGRAYGMARLLLRLPHSLALGRIPLAKTQLAAAGLSAHELLAGTVGAEGEALLNPYLAQIRGNLAEARHFVRSLPRQERVAFLPLALVGPYLRLLERQGGKALREEAQVVPLVRVLRLAAAHCLGRL
jgi:phytoene synthase